MKNIVLYIIFLCPISLIAQIKTEVSKNNVTNNSKILMAENITKTVNMPPVNVQKLIKEDENEVGPPRFGKKIDVNLGLQDGKWQETSDERIWMITIQSKDALSLNVFIQDLKLPDGSELYIKSNDNKVVFGPVTSKNHKNSFLASDIIPGDKLTIQLFEPKNVKGLSNLQITDVIHGYKSFGNYIGYGDSAPCHKDINCSEGDNWQNESNSVALAIVNGNRFCTGTLLNNQCQDFTPNLLTAFHCLDTGDGSDFQNGVLSQTERDATSNWTFRFLYKSPNCDGGDSFDFVSISGATFRSAWEPTDFALLELIQVPSENSNISYAGWSRSSTPPSSSVGIHHPRGDVMKISVENDPATAVSYFGGSQDHWRVTFDKGTVENGASGSALFNENGRVVGQLHGNQNNICTPSDNNSCFCDEDRIGEYGRFDLSWNGGGTPNTRLRDWLDPNNTGVNTTNTIRVPVISGSSQVCYSNRTFTIDNLPGGVNVNWTTSNNLNISSSTNNSITVQASSTTVSGDGWIRATFLGVCGNINIERDVWVGRPADPSPVQGSSDVVPNAWEYYSVPAQEEASSYTWNIPSGWSFHHTSSTTSNQVLLVTGSSSGYVAARANNECGVSNYRSKYVTVSGNDCGSPVCYFTYSPNPVEETLTVEMEPTTFDLLSSEKYQISLNNQYGKVVYEAESNSICHDIDMKKMPKGMYRIKVSYKGKQQIAKILKQ